MCNTISLFLNFQWPTHYTALQRFRGFGWNKVSWVTEAYLRDYHFEVLCDLFVIHVNHASRKKGGLDWTAHTQKIGLWYEQIYWPKRYEKNWAKLQWYKKRESEEDYVQEHVDYVKSKKRYYDKQQCHKQDKSTLDYFECFEPASEFIENSIIWSLVGGGAATPGDRVLELDEQLTILVKAEESAVRYLPLAHSQRRSKEERDSFNELMADLYSSLGVVEKNRNAISQAIAYFTKSLEFGENKQAQALLTELRETEGTVASFDTLIELPGPWKERWQHLMH